MKTWMLFSVMFFLGGFILLIPVHDFKKRREKLKHWSKTKALVWDISYSRFDSERNRTMAFPRYRFSHDGKEYEGMISHGITRGKYKPGDDIEVRFNPADPAESDAHEYLVIGPFTLLSCDLAIYVFTAMSVVSFALGIGSFLITHGMKG